MNHYLIWTYFVFFLKMEKTWYLPKKKSYFGNAMSETRINMIKFGLSSLQCCPEFWNLALSYIIFDKIKSVLMRKRRIHFIAIVRTKIYENKKATSKKLSSHGVLSLTLKTALSSQPDFYWNPHPANLNFMSSLFTTQLCYYYFFSLSGILNR